MTMTPRVPRFMLVPPVIDTLRWLSVTRSRPEDSETVPADRSEGSGGAK